MTGWPGESPGGCWEGALCTPAPTGLTPRVRLGFLLFPPSWVICSKQSPGGRSELGCSWGTGSCLVLSPSQRGAAPSPSPPAVPMADDIDWLDLPGRWTYGVCGDGRIFFIKYGPARPLARSGGCRGDGGEPGCGGSPVRELGAAGAGGLSLGWE